MKLAWNAAAAGLMCAAFAVQAQEYRQGDIRIENPWARPTAGRDTPGAAYMTIKNGGREADTLESASSPDAEKVEIHEHIHDANGVMRMRPVERGLKIPAGGTAELKPGGYHIMLIGLKHDLEEGQRIPLKLTFAHAGSVEASVKIEKTAGGH